VQADQSEQAARKQEHVDRVEARERVRADLRPAAQQVREERADDRARAVDVDADDGRPVRGLIPWEEVAREALGHAEREQQHTDEPAQLTGVLVRAEEEHAAHVQEHQDDEDARAPAVHAAHEPAPCDVVRDVLDRLPGLVRVGDVVHRQDDAGDQLHEERRQRRGAERLQPREVGRHLAEQEVLDAADEAGALLEPVDRREQHLLDLFPASGLLRACSHRHGASRPCSDGRAGQGRPLRVRWMPFIRSPGATRGT
jgi:hypothetical protein